MRRKRLLADKVKRFFKLLYLKLFRINDTPEKIALGAGLGVFSGILPGTGPIAAICLAFLFRANRAAALLGSLLTNTWLSFLLFLLALKTGSFITGVNWKEAQLAKLSFTKVIVPLATGYLIIGLVLGLLSYLLALAAVKIAKKRIN